MQKFILAFIVALAAPAWAGDYLEPEPSTYLEAAKRNRDLREAFDPAVMAHMIVEPSFQYNYAVLLEQKQGRSFIVVLQYAPEVESVLRRYDQIEQIKKDPQSVGTDANGVPIDRAQLVAELQKGLPPYPKDAKPERCEVEIDGAFAAKLIDAWRSVLSEVRPQKWEEGFDGEFYNFALRLDGKLLLGQTWSPRPDTRPGRLVKLGEMMRAHCQIRPDSMTAEADKLIRH